MGKKIAKKIRGLSWNAKASLILSFTLLFSVFMYQGWYKPRPAQAAVGFMAAYSANANNVAITAPTAGDLILVFAYRNASTTAPSLATGFTSIGTQGPGGSSNSGIVGWKISNGTETNSGTWTNATQVIVQVYRGTTATPIGTVATGAGNGTAIAYNTVALSVADGTSWVAGFAGAKAATAGMNGTTTALTANRTSLTTANGLDTNGGVASFGTQTLNVTGTGRWISWAIEIKALGPPTVTTPTATSITNTTATLGANVTSDGGATLTTRGTVWGTTTNPTGNPLAEGGTTTGVFTQARSSLTAGTKLYYRGYATNSVGTSYSPNGSFYTEPATQASGVTFSGVGPTGMTVNWTRGSGDGVIVLMKATSAVTGVPADGTYTAYTANTAYGSGTLITDGYVVYKGTGTSVPVTGLTNGTAYYVSVFEYKGTVDTSGDDQGTNYKPTPATGNQVAQAPADVTSPTIGTISVTPTSGIYTSSAPTISASLTDAESTVTSCEYTTDGSSWAAGTVSGAGSPWTCTANPVGLSGALLINIRATSTGGTGTGTQVTRTADVTAPTDGALTISPGNQLNSLSWGAATDATGILQYNVRFVTGTTPPASCAAGTSLYTGSNLAYDHTSLTNGQAYAYRVCATDNMGNVSAGATGSGTPATGTPNVVTAARTVIAGAATESTTGVVMQRLQIGTSPVGGSDNKIVLSSITMDDAGTATLISAVRVYIDSASSATLPTTAILIGGKSRWDGASTGIPLAGGTESQRTVNAGTPKYVYIVYDMAYGQSTRTVQSHVTNVGVSAPDTSATVNLSSNSFTLTAGSTAAVITACSGCHTYPPADATGNRQVPVGSVVGSHSEHSAAGCSTCHVVPATETSTDFGHRTGNIQFAGSVGYSRGTSFPQANVLNGSNLGNCTTASCHANVYGTGTSATPTWGTASGCEACHSVAIGANGPATGSHTLTGHVTACTACHATGTTATTAPTLVNGHTDGDIDVANVGYPANVAKHAAGSGYSSCSAASCHVDPYSTASAVTPVWGSTGSGCGACHSAYPIATTGPATGSHVAHNNTNCANCHTGATNSTTTPSANHADGNIDVTAGYPANVVKHAAGTYTGTCSTATCHANVYGTGTVTTPVWGVASGCEACHSTVIATTGPATGSHVAHNSTNCANCHTGATNSTTTPSANHADGNIDVNSGYPLNVTKHTTAAGFSGRTCSTATCHANVYGTGTVTTPVWGVASGCEACHSTAIATTGPATGSHVAHNSTNCALCHTGATNSTTIPSANHADGNIDVTAGYPANVVKHAAGTYTGTCSTATCHANVYGTGTVTTPVWGVASGCEACHATAIAATGPATGSHAAHNETNCALCHAGATNSTTSPTLNHADGNIDVTNGYPVTAKHTAGTYTGTCSTASCHADPYSAATATTPVWGSSSAGCSSCHSAHPITAAGPATGAHAKHMSLTGAVCIDCHTAGTTVTTVPTTGHGDGNIDVTGGYPLNVTKHAAGTGYNTCSTSNYCHSSGQSTTGGATPVYAISPNWGTTGTTCASCHKNMDADVAAPGDHVKHAQTNAISCATCHNGYTETTVAATTHVNNLIETSFSGTLATGTTYSQANQAVGNGYGNCTNSYCHSAAQSTTGGVTPASYATPVWGTTVTNCGSCHLDFDSNALATGDHVVHAQTKAIACATCHNGYTETTVVTATHVNKIIEIDFSGSTVATGTVYSQGSGAAGNNYGTCTTSYCHSTGQSTTGGATPTYASPVWNTAALTCGSCHLDFNSNASATGDHVKHAQGTANLSCATCHNGYTETTAATATHVNKTIELSFSGTNATGTTYSQGLTSAVGNNYGNCTTSKCHGSGAPVWGGALYSATVICENCHANGTPFYSTAATGAAPTKTTVATDSKVGAHNVHVLASSGYTNTIGCPTCHTVPGTITAAGHMNGAATPTFTGAAILNSATPSFATSTCTGTYCHGGKMIGGSNNGTDTSPTWNITTYLTGTPSKTGDCAACHGCPPNTASHGTEALGDCNGCHTHVNIDGSFTAGANRTLHMNGVVEATGGDCIGCHDTATDGGDGVPTRRAINEFNMTWSHKRTAGGTVTKFDCCVCHLEGNTADGSVNATFHKNNLINLRNPDTGDGTGLTAFTSFTRNTASNTLETWVTNVQNNLCLKCHDLGGAAHASAQVPTTGSAMRPFGTAPTHTPGNNVLNVDAHFATTNASYHPVKGTQNNDYCDTATMLAPWEKAKTKGSKTAGFLISCWDCHTTNGHGATATLLAPIEYGAAKTAPTAGILCLRCHDTNVYVSSAAGSAFGGTVADGGVPATSQIGTDASAKHGTRMTFKCTNCHSDQFADPGRPRRAENVHGFETKPAAWTQTGSDRPFAFLRQSDTAAWDGWRPRIGTTTNTTTGWGCSWSAEGGTDCSRSGEHRAEWSSYGPGGQF